MIIPDIKIYNDHTGSDIKTGSTFLILKFISPWLENDSNIRVDRADKHTVLQSSGITSLCRP